MENIWEGEGKPKMALCLLNNPTGVGARLAARAGAESLGIEIVADEEHTTTTLSEMEAMTRIKATNPDVIFFSSTPGPTAICIKNLYELGVYPGVTIGCAHASFTDVLVELAGADVTEGIYGVFPTCSWGDDVPAMAKMTEYCKKLHPKDYGKMDYMTSWAEALIDAEILRLALENCGYDKLAKGGVEAWRCVEMNGFRKLKDFSPGGLTGPVDFTDDYDRRGAKNFRLFQVQSGKIVPITDWFPAPVIKYEEFEWFK